MCLLLEYSHQLERLFEGPAAGIGHRLKIRADPRALRPSVYRAKPLRSEVYARDARRLPAGHAWNIAAYGEGNAAGAASPAIHSFHPRSRRRRPRSTIRRVSMNVIPPRRTTRLRSISAVPARYETAGAREGGRAFRNGRALLNSASTAHGERRPRACLLQDHETRLFGVRWRLR